MTDSWLFVRVDSTIFRSMNQNRKYHWPLGRRPDDHPGFERAGSLTRSTRRSANDGVSMSDKKTPIRYRSIRKIGAKRVAIS